MKYYKLIMLWLTAAITGCLIALAIEAERAGDRLTDMQEIIHEIHGMTVMMSGTGRVGEVVR